MISSTRKGFSRPLFAHFMRSFPTLEQASHFVHLRAKKSPYSRFVIQQIHADKWAVSRVISGGVV